MPIPPQTLNQARLALETNQPLVDVLRPAAASRSDKKEFAADFLRSLSRRELELALAQIQGQSDPVARLLLSNMKDYLDPGLLIDAYRQAGWTDSLLGTLVDFQDAAGLGRALALQAGMSGDWTKFIAQIVRQPARLLFALDAGLTVGQVLLTLRKVRDSSPTAPKLLGPFVSSLPRERSPELEAAIREHPEAWAALADADPQAETARAQLLQQQIVASSINAADSWDAP